MSDYEFKLVFRESQFCRLCGFYCVQERTLDCDPTNLGGMLQRHGVVDTRLVLPHGQLVRCGLGHGRGIAGFEVRGILMLIAGNGFL